MTEKRYLYYEEPNGEFPFPYIKRDDGKEIISLYECSELLNSLVDENEQLKQKVKHFEAQLYCENEDGVCLICKNHYLVKGKTYDKYYISKCKKEHDECSTETLRHCKDFELKQTPLVYIKICGDVE